MTRAKTEPGTYGMAGPEVDMADTRELASDVYNRVFHDSDSFESDNIGSNLAYLMGAILRDGWCEWSEKEPFVQVLRGSYPDPDHPVWHYIIIDDPND